MSEEKEIIVIHKGLFIEKLWVYLIVIGQLNG